MPASSYAAHLEPPGEKLPNGAIGLRTATYYNRKEIHRALSCHRRKFVYFLYRILGRPGRLPTTTWGWGQVFSPRFRLRAKAGLASVCVGADLRACNISSASGASRARSEASTTFKAALRGCKDRSSGLAEEYEDPPVSMSGACRAPLPSTKYFSSSPKPLISSVFSPSRMVSRLSKPYC